MEYYQERLSKNLALDVQDKSEPTEIYVYDDNRIEVIFKFEDELKRIAEITEFAME